MALNQMGLGFLFTAKDEASATVAKLERSLGNLGNKTEAVKGQLVHGAIGAGIAAGGLLSLRSAFAMSKEAGLFQQALVDVQSISGATAAELKALEVAAIDAGIKTQFSPQQAVGGLRDLAAAGYNATDSIKLLQPSLALAAGSLGELTPQQAAGVAAQTLKAFALSADDASLAVDKLLATSNMFAVQTSELPSLIGHVVRGAASYGASLDEALSAAGLARNVLGNIELATTGLSVAMERLIKKHVQKALKGIGVEVVNAAGGFNQFLDVLTGMTQSKAFNAMSDAGKAGFINKSFGHHALGAVNSILVQLNGGIKTMTGETVRGAEAVAYLRGQFADAAGTAKKFADARLDTLPGQLELLGGSIKTFRIVVGKELAPIFRPFVEGALNGLNKVIAAWQGLTPEMKAAIIKFAVGIAAIATAFGTLIFMKAGIMSLGLLFSALGTTVGALALSFAPVIVGMLGLIAVGALLYKAYEKNFGGFANVVDSAWKKISLAVRGIGQLFSSGALSGEVMTELNKTENGGVKDFVVNLYMWGGRIKNIFDGFVKGFDEISPRLEPVFKALLASLRQLGAAFGITTGTADDNADSFDKFGEVGETIGRLLAGALADGLVIVNWSLQLMTELISEARSAWDLFGGSVGTVLQIIGGAFQLFFGLLQGDSSMFWKGFVNLGIGAIKIITGAVYLLLGTLAKIADFFSGGRFGLSASVAQDKASTFSDLDSTAAFWKKEIENPEPQALGGPLAPALAASGLGSPSLAAAAMDGSRDLLIRALAERAAERAQPAAPQQDRTPLQANLYIDGEKLVSTIARIQRSSDARSFQSVSTGGVE